MMDRQIGSGAAMFDVANPLLADGQKAAFALARMQGQALRAVMEYQMEALSFLRHRYEEDLRLFDDIAGTDELKDVMQVYNRFCESAVKEYAQEAVKLAGMTKNGALEAAQATAPRRN